MNRIRALVFLVFAASFAVPAQADEEAIRAEHLTARLVAENAATRPGDTVTVALHLAMTPGWHTYWRNPGDSGQPPTLVWDAPEGVEVSPSEWPAPERIPYGSLVNFGYSDETALLFKVKVPSDWPAGRPLPLSAEAEILVCEDICIPVTGRLATGIATGTESLADPATAPLLAKARAEQPLDSPWPVVAAAGEGHVALTLRGPRTDFAAVQSAFVFADTWGALDHAATQRLSLTEDGLTVTAPLGAAPPDGGFSGVVTLFQESGPSRSFIVTNAPISASDALGANPAPGLTLLLVLALAGGVLLNLMPCVFPVLAVKAVGLAKQADETPARRLAHGGAYTAGVVASFLVLAAVLIVLRAGGEAVGWGFQLQEPLVVAALAYVVMAVGLNLSGLFEVGGRLAGLGGTVSIGSGHGGSFATGVLAAVVAAPCTAPFMATAIGGALLLPPAATLGVFAALGLGLALPYLLLTASPALGRLMPRPGQWMVRFKQFLAFPMYATAAWLIWVLSRQAGPDAAFMATLGLIAIAFAAWALPERPFAGQGAARAVRVLAVLVPLAGATGALGWIAGTGAAPVEPVAAGKTAEPYSEARLQELVDAGRPVFVNMTADWCITCKVNERVALSGSSFTDLLAAHNIAYLQGDWTNRDPEITRFLERFGRLGVPLYVLYPPGGGEPSVLPQILAPGAVRDALSSLASGPA